MGNSLCRPQNSPITLLFDPTTSRPTTGLAPDNADFGCTDASEGDDEPTPLKQFITAHSSSHPICASNSLRFQSNASHPKQAPKIQSVKLLKPKGGEERGLPKEGATGPGVRRKAGKMPRCSIDVMDVSEFQETVRGFVVSEKHMESYGRIDIHQGKFIHLRKEDIKKYYKFEEIVGEGAYGSVYRAKCLKSKETRAIKIIKKEHLARAKKDEVFAELELLKKMDHPNIIKLYEVFEWENRYQVVTEYCNGGSIIDFIKGRSQFHEDLIRTILKQLLGCLNYLSTIKVVHRDIKLENVVFIKKVDDNSASEEIEIKLLDFGTACWLAKPKMKCSELVGTVSYMPPEIIKGYFTERCDLWSCGVIFYILLTSKSPFKCKKKEETLQKILTLEVKFESTVWQEVSGTAKDLLQQLLEKDPYKRVSADQALKHPWFLPTKSKARANHSGFLRELSHYYRQNNLISVLESYLVFSKVGQEDRKRINDIFKEFDHNQDGFIEKKELLQAYREMAPDEFNHDEIAFILAKIDKDNSGSINLSEFTSAVVDREKLWAKTALEQAFDYFDTDKTGFIERQELGSLMSGCENAEIQSLLLELDADKDSKISKDEFINYLLKHGCLF